MGEYRNVCYLVHFDKPVGNSKAQHYLGFAKSLPERIAKHRASKGAAITARANKLGIGWRVVRVWRNADADAEIALKAMLPKNLCPYCNKRAARQKYRAELSESSARVA